MSETPSNMLPLGTIAPNFKLLDTICNETLELDDLKSGIATVIMFICNHCPYVKHIQTKLVEVANTYQAKGFRFIAISSNDVATYADDSPEKMREEAANHHYPFPYLYDETQAIAKAYQAACTPDFYVFNEHMHCVYRGRFDASTPGNQEPVTGKELTAALDAILTGDAIDQNQKPSVGCNIKWKK